MLTNKHNEKLGVFILQFNEVHLQKMTFLMRDANKLDIGDCNIYINRRDGIRELVLSYKSIYINTFNLLVLDLDMDTNKNLIFRHESFQLWESEVQGTLLQKSKDFLSVNKDGISVVALGSEVHRPVVDANGVNRMLHSLESVSFLKIDPDNYLNFAS